MACSYAFAITCAQEARICGADNVHAELRNQELSSLSLASTLPAEHTACLHHPSVTLVQHATIQVLLPTSSARSSVQAAAAAAPPLAARLPAAAAAAAPSAPVGISAPANRSTMERRRPPLQPLPAPLMLPPPLLRPEAAVLPPDCRSDADPAAGAFGGVGGGGAP